MFNKGPEDIDLDFIANFKKFITAIFIYTLMWRF